MEKIWKNADNPNYLVSDHGDIFNIKRDKMLNKTIHHEYVTAYNKISRGGSAFVHRIVYETFVGDIPEGMQINHLDGNKQNNKLDNLELCTASQNVQHAFDTGLKRPLRGSEVTTSKVTEEQVLQMYGMFKLGYSNSEVAGIFEIESKHVSLIRHGKRWKHLFERESMQRYESIGLSFPLPKAIYIYNMCMESEIPQDDLGKLLGIDPSQVSRIRTGEAWERFRKHFGIQPESYNWREIRSKLKVKTEI